jgi:hypothetical protein
MMNKLKLLSSTITNKNIPDSPFKIFSNDTSAGSKRQDLRALAAILVAWQVG